jgi:hypothetical protein
MVIAIDSTDSFPKTSHHSYDEKNAFNVKARSLALLRSKIESK